MGVVTLKGGYSDPYSGRTLMRAFLDAILPPGTLWQPAPGEDFDHFLDGIGDNLQGVHDALELLAHIRDPATTPYLDELEREYGITPNIQLTDAQRRANLLDAKYARNRHGTISPTCRRPLTAWAWERAATG